MNLTRIGLYLICGSGLVVSSLCLDKYNLPRDLIACLGIFLALLPALAKPLKRSRELEVLALIWFIPIIASVINSQDLISSIFGHRLSGYEIIKLWLCCGLAAMIGVQLSPFSRSGITLPISGAAVLTAFIALFQAWGLVPGTIQIGGTEFCRAVSTLGHPSFAASMMVLGVPAVLALYCSDRAKLAATYDNIYYVTIGSQYKRSNQPQMSYIAQTWNPWAKGPMLAISQLTVYIALFAILIGGVIATGSRGPAGAIALGSAYLWLAGRRRRGSVAGRRRPNGDPQTDGTHGAPSRRRDSLQADNSKYIPDNILGIGASEVNYYNSLSRNKLITGPILELGVLKKLRRIFLETPFRNKWVITGLLMLILGGLLFWGPHRSGDSMRIEQNVVAVRAWIEHPVLGYGPGNYLLGFLKHRTEGTVGVFNSLRMGQSHSHNFVTNLLATQGLIGLVVFIVCGLVIWGDTRDVWARALYVMVGFMALWSPLPPTVFLIMSVVVGYEVGKGEGRLYYRTRLPGFLMVGLAVLLLGLSARVCYADRFARLGKNAVLADDHKVAVEMFLTAARINAAEPYYAERALHSGIMVGDDRTKRRVAGAVMRTAVLHPRDPIVVRTAIITMEWCGKHRAVKRLLKAYEALDPLALWKEAPGL